METRCGSYPLGQEIPRLSPISSEQLETLEEVEEILHPPHPEAAVGKIAGRTPGEIGREIAQDVRELGAALAEPHHHDCAMAEGLLDASDELRHVAQDERFGGDPLRSRGPRQSFGRRPPPAES